MIEEFCKKYGVLKDDVIWLDLLDDELSRLEAFSGTLKDIKYIQTTNQSVSSQMLANVDDYLTNYFCFNRLNNDDTKDIIYENRFHKDKIFESDMLTYHENTFIRGKPKEYILHTIKLFKRFTRQKLVLEIGSVRHTMQHAIEEFNPACCNDGHSTYFWSHYTDADIHTVDIAPHCKHGIIDVDQRLTKVTAHIQDAIEFAKTFNKQIDLLFLDAWDVVPGDPYAEKHLEIYKILKDNLADDCLILIDDTDIGGGGKGRLVMPELIKDGFDCLFNKRQALFIRRKE